MESIVENKKSLCNTGFFINLLPVINKFCQPKINYKMLLNIFLRSLKLLGLVT
jgi:hypothetical protein